MYDIYFDLNDMHQPVEETPANKLSKLYDELTEVSKAQASRAEAQTDVQEFWMLGESFSFDFVHKFPVDKLDEDDDDFAVIVEKKFGCTCEKCGEHYPDAESKDGFKCWACKNF
jgi:hypothetical protein